MRLGRLVAVALALVGALFVTVVIHHEVIRLGILKPHILLVDPYNQYNLTQIDENVFMLTYGFPTGKIEDVACIFLKSRTGLDKVYISVVTDNETSWLLYVKLCGIAGRGSATVNNTSVLYNGTLYINETKAEVSYTDVLYRVQVYLTRTCPVFTTVNATGNANFTLVFDIESINCETMCYPVVCFDYGFETSIENVKNITLVFTIR